MANVTDELRARAEARASTIRALRELDAQALCTCPACVRLRQMQGTTSHNG